MSSIEFSSAHRVALVTNIPAPYRMPVYRRLAEQLGHDQVQVIFCSEKEANREWLIEQSHFACTYLKKNCLSWKGRYIHCNVDVVKVLRRLDPDVVITTGFNPTHLLAFGFLIGREEIIKFFQHGSRRTIHLPLHLRAKRGACIL